MRTISTTAAATLAAVLVSLGSWAALAAQAPAKDRPVVALPQKPAPAPTAEPTPGTIFRDTVPGGWILEIAGDPDHLLVQVPGYSPSTGRTLITTAASSETYEKLITTAANVIGADGKTLRLEPLHGYHTVYADLSPDGRNVGIIAEPWEEGGNRAVLVGFGEGGKIWKRPATQQGDIVLAGKTWIAEVTPPKPPAVLDDAENDPPSPAAEPQKPLPVRFFDREGNPFHPPNPISGAVQHAGDGLVAVFDRELHVYDGELNARGKTELGFDDAFPLGSADGSLIAVADYRPVDASNPQKERSLLLFDAHAKKIGTFSMPATVGIAAALAPDGSSFLATPATLGEDGPARTIEADKNIYLALADRTGKIRWKYSTERRTEVEHAGSLSVSAGGKRAACGFFADDPDEHPDRAVVFDEHGKVLYQAEGSFQAVWLDPTGEWLYTIEDDGLSKLRVKDLVAGTAFPKDADGD